MSYQLFVEDRVIARQEHQCIWCGERILVRERYIKESSVYDGRFQNHKWHIECHRDAPAHFHASLDDSFSPGAYDRPDRQLGFLLQDYSDDNLSKKRVQQLQKLLREASGHVQSLEDWSEKAVGEPENSFLADRALKRLQETLADVNMVLRDK